jgi:predicted RNase H-like HicB family nuclease
MPHVYSALLEPEPEGGFTVSFPELGFGATYGATYGATRDDALHRAEDTLEGAVLGLIVHRDEARPSSVAPIKRRQSMTLERAVRIRGVRISAKLLRGQTASLYCERP